MRSITFIRAHHKHWDIDITPVNTTYSVVGKSAASAVATDEHGTSGGILVVRIGGYLLGDLHL